MDNRTGEIEAFLRSVDAGSFAAAAQQLRQTPSAVSRSVARLEARLGVRLLQRSTRALTLTPEGEAYKQRAQAILHELDELEASFTAERAEPRGRLRLNASVLVPNLITPVISGYAAHYPGVSVRLTVTGRMVDLIEDNYDIAVRHKAPPNPGLIVRKVADYRFMVCGSPKYFEQRAKPNKPADLVDHNCLIYTDSEHGERWPIFNTDDDMLVAGSLHSNNIMSLVEAAENGLGLTVAPHFAVEDSLRRGRLIAVLTEFTTSTFPIAAIYPHREAMPLKVRLFIDMLAKHLRALPAFRDAPTGSKPQPILLPA